METTRDRVIRTPGQPRNQSAGFSLIELLITIVIAAILAAVATPSFKEFIANQRIKTAAYDIMALLTLARSEAIKRDANVSLNADGQVFTITTVDPVTSSTITLRNERMPAGVTFSGFGTVTYGGNGRLAAAFTPVQIGSTSTGTVSCISIDLSGRPAGKKGAC